MRPPSSNGNSLGKALNHVSPQVRIHAHRITIQLRRPFCTVNPVFTHRAEFRRRPGLVFWRPDLRPALTWWNFTSAQFLISKQGPGARRAPGWPRSSAFGRRQGSALHDETENAVHHIRNLPPGRWAFVIQQAVFPLKEKLLAEALHNEAEPIGGVLMGLLVAAI